MAEDQEALFSSYPCAVYYVQSPSTISHANSTDCRNNESALLSPFQSGNFITNHTNRNQELALFTLSRYSSSRGSNNSFLHEKKIAYDLRSHEIGTENGETNQIIGCKDEVGDDEVYYEDNDEVYYVDDDDDDEDGRRNGWWRYFSFGTYPSCGWISLQISWRLMVSLGAALLVFFLATKPPPPKMTIKMAGIRQFGLGEGVDNTGVSTKILTCNCSMNLEIENKSKLFGLHIQPPIMDVSFESLIFATSQGPTLYAASNSRSTFQLYVGTKNKPMYGAGRSMEDELESGIGLPLVIHIKLSSSFRVVWNLIRPRFHHRAECFLVLRNTYDKLHHTQAYNSSCVLQSYT